jgi:hypothetical protein
MNEDIQYLYQHETITLDGKDFVVEALPFPDRSTKRSVVLSRNQELYWLTPYDNVPDIYLLTTLSEVPRVPLSLEGKCIEALVMGSIIQDITGVKLNTESA